LPKCELRHLRELNILQQTKQ